MPEPYDRYFPRLGRPDLSRLGPPPGTAQQLQDLLDELLHKREAPAPPAAPPPAEPEPQPVDQTAHDPLSELAPPTGKLMTPPRDQLNYQPYASFNRREWIDEYAQEDQPPPQQDPPPPRGQAREVPPVEPLGSEANKAPGALSADNAWGALEPGNIDLRHRPHVKNADGSVSTVYSMGVELDGKQYLIPLVSDDGRIMTPDEGIAEFRRTGKHLGVYASPAASDRAAQAIHEDQEKNPPIDTLGGRQAQGAQARPISVLVDGKHYVVPSIGEDGRQLSVNEAIAELQRTGKHFGTYKSTEESEAAAEALRSGGDAPPAAAPSTGRWQDPYAPQAAQEPPIPHEPPAGEQPAPQSALDEYTDELLRRPDNYAASTLSRITPERSQGEEPDFYGYDDEKGFSVDERVRRARESYQQQKPSTRWEDEFLDRHLRPEDQSVRARAAVLGFFGTGDDAKSFRDDMYKRQQDFDKGQAEARGRDRSESQIDPGLAEAIAATGMMSPEAASRLTYGSPVVQAFVQGGYNVGPRRAQQELERDKLRYGMLDRYATGEQKEQGDLVTGMQRQETARLMAEGQKVTEEERQGAMRGAIMMAYGVPKDVAERVVATYGQDMNGVPEQFKTQVQSILEVGNVARSRTDLRTLMGMVAQLAKGPAQTDQRIQGAAGTNYYGSDNVNKTGQLRGMVRVASDARKAWKALTPNERALYVKLDRTKPIAEQIKALGLDTKAQVNVSRLDALNNLFNRINSGLTQTPSEIAAAAREQGITLDGWVGLGKDPAVYGEFLRRTARFYALALQDRRKMLPRPTNATKR